MTYIITATADARRKARHGSTGPVQLLDPLTARQERLERTGRGIYAHLAGQPGLRAHSVDSDIYPWLVVGGHAVTPDGLVNTWELHSQDGCAYVRRRYRPDDEHGGQSACRLIHDAARAFKIQWPEGKITGDVNFTGTPDDFVERARGHYLTFRRHNEERITGRVDIRAGGHHVLLHTIQGPRYLHLERARNPQYCPIFEITHNPNPY